MNDFKKDLDIIFSSLAKTVFPKMTTSFKMPNGFNTGSITDFYIISGTFNHHTILRKKIKKYYTKITISCSKDPKLYRDKLIEILKEKDIEMEIGMRMPLSVNTEELLHEYRHLLTSVKATNKFKL